MGLKKEFGKEAPQGSEARADQPITMIYSAQADDFLGHYIASVPDGKGGKKEIKYTAIDDPDKQKWSDKQIVWKGKTSEYELLGPSPKAEEFHQKTLRDLRSTIAHEFLHSTTRREIFRRDYTGPVPADWDKPSLPPFPAVQPPTTKIR